MTIVIFALDGLDAEYAEERELLANLGPRKLDNNLQGANGLYTYRIWPSIFAGVNEGASEKPYDSYDPEEPYIWTKYGGSVLLAPVDHSPTLKYQSAFPQGYVESVGPQERTDKKFAMYREGIEDALRNERDIVVVGSKLPDILGHNDQNTERIHENIETLCNLVESTCKRPDVSDYLVVSDHGFEYESFGDEPSGLDAHTPRAVLASSFADYDAMDSFIEEWHSDLLSALKEKRLADLGYI